ncbi:MAG TPA: hypothetical protein VMX13_15225 [Sedimentisphaerales bacterium]|nr:hypothetical protein [Sedimentisphaerales bacterium]
MIVRTYKSLIAVAIGGLVVLVGLLVFRPCRSPEPTPAHSLDGRDHNPEPTPAHSLDGPNDKGALYTRREPRQLPQQPQRGSKSPTDIGLPPPELGGDELDFMADDTVDLIDSESTQVMMRDPRLLVKIHFQGATPYHSIAKSLDATSLPAFYEVLRDVNSSGYELDQAVIFIGQISERGNEEAANALVEFAKQGVNWDKWKWRDDEPEVDLHVISKWHALDSLGYIGGENAETVLRRAMTADGAKELTKEWLGGVPVSAFAQDSVVANLRGYAAKGLAFSPKPAMHDLIRSEYDRERQACIDAGVIAAAYFNQLCDAMARMDVVKEVGIEAHRALYDGQGSYSALYGKHIRKYLLFEAVDVVEKQP